LNQFNTAAEYHTAIDGIPNTSGGTNIPEGLMKMLEQFSLPNGDRPDAKDVFIVLTDGVSGGDFTAARNEIQSRGIEAFGIGVGGGVNAAAIMAGLGISMDNYFSVSDFENLVMIIAELKKKACNMQGCEVCDWEWTTANATHGTAQAWGYVHENCAQYRLCLIVDGVVTEYIRPCARGTYWNQNFLTCTTIIPPSEYCEFSPNTNVIPPIVQCELQANPDDVHKYFDNGVENTCPAFTFFDHCACILEDPPVCNDLILYVPCDTDFNDHSCNQAYGGPYGNPQLDTFHKKGSKSCKFDGSSLIQFDFFKNYLNGKNQQTWTVMTWVYQPTATSDMGIVGQYDCGTSNNFAMGTTSVLAGGAITTDTSPQTSAFFDIIFNDWVHYAMVYDGSFIKFFRNGIESVYFEPLTGPIKNSPCTLTLGSVIVDASTSVAFNFKGFIDDTRIYSTAKTAAEIIAIMSI
jgi:hypothetical protein